MLHLRSVERTCNINPIRNDSCVITAQERPPDAIGLPLRWSSNRNLVEIVEWLPLLVRHIPSTVEKTSRTASDLWKIRTLTYPFVAFVGLTILPRIHELGMKRSYRLNVVLP